MLETEFVRARNGCRTPSTVAGQSLLSNARMIDLSMFWIQPQRWYFFASVS